jgi:hypothetical protein
MVSMHTDQPLDRSGRRHLCHPESDTEPSQPACQPFLAYRIESVPLPFISFPSFPSFSSPTELGAMANASWLFGA